MPTCEILILNKSPCETSEIAAKRAVKREVFSTLVIFTYQSNWGLPRL